MVNRMKLAAILEHENLVRHVMRHVFWWDFNLGSLRSVCLGDVEDFAPRFGVIFAVVAAESGFVFVEPDIRERRGDTG